MDAGTYVELDGRPAVRFQRDYDHPVQRLWSAITDPDELPHWFPSNVTMKPEVGGPIEFTGDGPPSSGTILVYEPPTRLAYSWGDNELRFELEPIGDHGCRFTLIDVLPARNIAARNAAAGPHSGTREAWRKHYDSYVAAGMPSGAEIPGG
jgi:uncharacterized protein YndB with AHSA1/START domain